MPATSHDAHSTPESWQSEEELKPKRNRLQECKTCCCRPISILAIIAIILLLIAAIIAIIVTSVADNFEREMEGSQDDVKPYTANLDELPAALKDQVLQSQQGFRTPSFNNPQYYSNGQQPNGYPPMNYGAPNNGFQPVGPGYNAQYPNQRPIYGYNPSQQFTPSNLYNGKR